MTYKYVILNGKEIDVTVINEAGYDAAERGRNVNSNPYNKDGNEDELYAHDEWVIGRNRYSFDAATAYVANVAKTTFLL